MSSHYVSGSRPVTTQVLPYSLNTGTSSTSTDEVELRVLDGANLTDKDIITAMDAFKQFILNRNLSSAFSTNP